MVPTVRVVITFTKFVELQPVDNFYTPVSSPRQLASGRSKVEESSTAGEGSGYLSLSKSWLRGGGSSRQQASKVEEDPLRIPAGYVWSSFDEKNRRTRRSKSTRKSK